MRDRFLRVVVIFGVALLVITETLGAFNALSRGPLIAAWLLVIAAVIALPPTRRLFRISRPSIPLDPIILLCAAGMAAIFTLTFVIAACSPPNSVDAMQYHLPRVIYWAEMHSVRFFPTSYYNQIMLQPLTEYLMLHTYLLSGGDRFVNFIAWGSSVVCAIGVSSIAACLGVRTRGQWIAALFCAALPVGILLSSGAKNDNFVSMWIVAAVYFAFQAAQSLTWSDTALAGAALGLALCTKGTAYLFAPFVLLAAVGPAISRAPRRMAGLLAAGIAIPIALNAPQYARNYSLSGSPMGFDSTQADRVYRWRNDPLGWKPTLSNILRNVSEQLGGPARWNSAVSSAVRGIHSRMGIDINDPVSTWHGAGYRAPTVTPNEGSAPNGLALFVLTILGCIAIFRAFTGRNRERAYYAISLVVAFFAFCAYLKFQRYMSRLFLPLFVLGSPFAGMLDEFPLAMISELVLCLLLFAGAQRPLLDNLIRPLRGPHSVLHTDRITQYFSDLKPWNRESSDEAVRQLAPTQCGLVGIDIELLQNEYPLQVLLREQEPSVMFVHTGVENPSAKYAQPVPGQPCAVVCLFCANDPARLSLYKDFPKQAEAGRFVIFTR